MFEKKWNFIVKSIIKSLFNSNIVIYNNY